MIVANSAEIAVAATPAHQPQYISKVCKVILVSGISCSGKTTLASRIASEMGGAVLSIDDYYRPYENLSLSERRAINFDSPESVEHELLIEHLRDLLAGHAVHKPVYDFASFSRIGSEPFYPTDVIVVEGLFSLYWSEINDLAAMRIFVEANPAVCLARRLERDAVERGRGEYESMTRYKEHVQPNQERYVLPTRAHSDVVVSGEDCLESNVHSVSNRIRAIAYLG